MSYYIAKHQFVGSVPLNANELLKTHPNTDFVEVYAMSMDHRSGRYCTQALTSLQFLKQDLPKLPVLLL